MNGRIRHALPLTFAALFLLFVAGCGPSHRLSEYQFSDQTAAVIAAYPPRATVTTSAGDAWFDPYRPVRSLFRVGTAVAKWEKAEEAQARLDSALQEVDVVDAMARALLASTAPAFGLRVENDRRAADFLFDVRVGDYGIHADSWEGATFFVLTGEVLLIDNKDQSLIWKRGISERELVTGAAFGLGTTVGNVLTAQALANLSSEEIAVGMEAIALDAAHRISRKLRDDLYASR